MNSITTALGVFFGLCSIGLTASAEKNALSYPIVGTGTESFYSNLALIDEPSAGEPFYGQDASYQGNQPSYTDNSDGTITDNITCLMWQKDMGEKQSWMDALDNAGRADTGGYEDWRMPTIKELYSLILFTGVNGRRGSDSKLFIDSNYFNHPLGDPDKGERHIDAQTWSATKYAGVTMGRDETIFGVNFVDGRIKGYPLYHPRTGKPHKMYTRYVRGNPDYGKNRLIDKGDGTITDEATGLMWQAADDGEARDWENALAYAESLELANYSDWRLPNAKELQSIVDYSRSPQTSHSPAIDPLFKTTKIKDPGENPGQYPYFWTSTTHLDGPNPYASAVYIAFGESRGLMRDRLFDVHGAGAQRSDPKTGPPERYPEFFGPQGDVRYVYNYVRCVRNVN